MKILVTGGAGYIGSIVVEQLIRAGHSVVVFDNLYQGHREAVHPQAAFFQGDLADPAAIAAAFAAHRPEAVMHFASHTLVGESMQEPFRYLGENVTNALNLLRAAVDGGVRRFILSSTANLFDAPERIPIAETEKIVPGSPYGESKHIIERFLHWLDRIHGLRYAALRYFNAAGATEQRGEDHHPEYHLIPIRRTAPACATTSTSSTWRRPTSWPCRPWTAAVACTIWATDRDSASSRSSTWPAKSLAIPSRRASARAAPGTRPCWWPAASGFATNSAGNRNSPTCATSSPPPGAGTVGIRRGTQAK